ncbi:hypothetical protein DAI22_11g134850 [Oryza sativa Japonica Group]|nr:hypothetical protein DAI22_11g134850 [Oryza sativa Japonica Group]
MRWGRFRETSRTASRSEAGRMGKSGSGSDGIGMRWEQRRSWRRVVGAAALGGGGERRPWQRAVGAAVASATTGNMGDGRSGEESARGGSSGGRGSAWRAATAGAAEASTRGGSGGDGISARWEQGRPRRRAAT